MGRTQVFKGVELVIPDAYSALDLTRLLTPTSGGVGIVALIGEADGGKPGLTVFAGGSSPSIVKKELKSGPGADMTRLALRSGVDSLVQAGASTVLFFKTNNSTQSQLALGVTAAVAEVRQFTTRADVASDLAGKYLDSLVAANGTVYYVGYTDGVTPAPVLGGKTLIQVTFTANDTANTIASLTRAAISGVSGAPFVVSGSGAQVIVANAAVGAVADLVDGAVPTGFTGISTTTQGVDADSANFTIKTKQYGAFTALYTAAISTSLSQKFLTIRDQDGVPETSVGVGLADFIQINRSNSGGAIAAQVKLSYVSGALKLVGQHNLGSGLVTAFDLDVTSLSLSQVKSIIEGNYAGWTVTIPSIGFASLGMKELDMVLAYQPCWNTVTYGFKASVYELVQWASQSSELVEIERGVENEVTGVPGSLAVTQLTGGTRGTTSNASVQAACNELLKLRVNIMVPLFSSDNQDGSTVAIASVNSIIKDHVTSRSSILGRSECQAYVSIKGNKSAFKAECARMGSRLVAVSSQKVTDLDIDGNTKVFDEYAFSVVCAQTQAGSPIGTPLTYRLLPVIGISQDVSWNPIENGPEMIKAGGLIASLDENNQIRIVAGYSSWLGDSNNANIYIETVESLAIFAFNHRAFMKEKFLGQANFTTQDILDAIKASLEAERDTTRSIKGFDFTQTKLISTTAGRLEYELAVIPFEGIVFVLPTIVAIREAA